MKPPTDIKAGGCCFSCWQRNYTQNREKDPCRKITLWSNLTIKNVAAQSIEKTCHEYIYPQENVVSQESRRNCEMLMFSSACCSVQGSVQATWCKPLTVYLAMFEPNRAFLSITQTKFMSPEAIIFLCLTLTNLIWKQSRKVDSHWTRLGQTGLKCCYVTVCRHRHHPPRPATL